MRELAAFIEACVRMRQVSAAKKARKPQSKRKWHFIWNTPPQPRRNR